MSMQQAVDHVLSQAVNPQAVPGVIAIAATDREIIYEGAFGKRTLGHDAAMTLDTTVWIASMTKAITGAAAMQLVEQGKLQLDTPASDVVSDLAKTQVLTGFDASDKPQLRAPKRPITLRHLQTHTAGFSYDMWNADIAKYEKVTGTPTIVTCKNAALTSPLVFDPGDRWEYGIGIDWIGKMVEAVSGQKLGQYLQQHLFAPLGMNDTSFKVSPAQKARLAGMHQRQPDGSLVVIPFGMPQEPEFEMGGGGLCGTAHDYIRFTRMILNGGTLDGIRVLQPETVQMMSQNQMGDIHCAPMKTVIPTSSHDADFFPGMKQQWGFSFLINTEQSPQGRSAGSLAWAGLGNTYYWIDPVKQVTGVLFTQILPFFDPKAISLFRAFETAVYQAL
jgi:methyl acetate hydrolase